MKSVSRDLVDNMYMLRERHAVRHSDKRRRARLINLQRQQVTKDLRHMYFLWEPQSMELVTPFNNRGNWDGMSKEFVQAMLRYEFKWRVEGFICARQTNGKEDLHREQMIIKTPCKNGLIKGAVADFVMEMAAEFQHQIYGKNFITCGWCASVLEAPELPSELLFNMLKKTGAYDLLSDQEERKRNAAEIKALEALENGD